MPTVREILEKNNMKLDISEKALNLEFEGDFIFTKTIMEPVGDQWNHPDETTLAYVFDSKDKRLRIAPDDPNYVVGYNRFDDAVAKTGGYYECYGSDGEVSIML